MKKLTAGIFTVMLGLVAVDANAAITSKAWVESKLATKQDTLTAGDHIEIDKATNTIKAINLASSADLTALEGKVATAEGNITTLKGADTVDGSVANTVKTKIEALDVTATTGTGVIGSISQTDGKVAATYKTIKDADVAADAAIAQSKISGLTTDLANKQNKLTNATNGSTHIVIDDTTGKISVKDLATSTGLNDLTGRVDTTEKDIVGLKEKDTELAKKDEQIEGKLGTVPDGKNLTDMITSAENNLKADINRKQDNLNGEQMNAVNSGITADKVTALSELTIHGKIPAVCQDPAAQAGCALIYQGNSFKWEVIERDSNNN